VGDRFLFVHKFKDLSDHLLFAMLLGMQRLYSGIDCLSFYRYEKPRDNPALGAKKFIRGVERYCPGVIFAYDSPLSIDEMRFVTSRGIRLASNTVGLDSFYCGGAASQDEAFNILRGYAWYFVNHAPHVPRLRAEGVNAFPLPMAYEPRWFHPLEGVTPRYDVLFVGDIHSPLNAGRRALLEHVSRYFRVAVLSYKPTGLPHIEELPAEVNPYRLNRILNQAKIVLGSDRVGDIGSLNRIPGQFIFYDDEFYLRQRAYIAIGAGCCYVVERHPEISRQFEEGREIILWSDYAELCDQLDYYLAHDDERRAIGQAGHQRALMNYTVEHLLHFVLETMGLLPRQADG